MTDKPVLSQEDYKSLADTFAKLEADLWKALAGKDQYAEDVRKTVCEAIGVSRIRLHELSLPWAAAFRKNFPGVEYIPGDRKLLQHFLATRLYSAFGYYAIKNMSAARKFLSELPGLEIYADGALIAWMNERHDT